MEAVIRASRLARGLLLLSLPAAERESIPGDLDEEFTSLVATGASVAAARAWYWRQVWRSVTPLLSIRWRRAEVQETAVVILLTFGVLLSALDGSEDQSSRRPYWFECASLLK
jgi:hypothetical protein